MFEICMYFSVFYFVCYVEEISTDMLEEQVSEERDLELNDQEGIRMEYSRKDHCRDVSKDGENNINIHSLR